MILSILLYVHKKSVQLNQQNNFQHNVVKNTLDFIKILRCVIYVKRDEVSTDWLLVLIRHDNTCKQNIPLLLLFVVPLLLKMKKEKK